MTGAVNVFTYGSLMYDAVWSRLADARYRSVAAVIEGHRRFAVAGETYPALIAAPGHRVAGRLWLAVGPADVERLDRFEGPDYQRCRVMVTVDPAVDPSGQLEAQCYRWRDVSRLLPDDWDVAAFERDHLSGFAQRHGAGDEPAGDEPVGNEPVGNEPAQAQSAPGAPPRN